MRIAATVARILLGLIFFASGASGFLPIQPPPPPPGLAGTFFTAYSQSHWILVVDGVQLIAGALLLAGQYVPLALTVLAAVIFNMIVFHLTMQLAGLPAPLVLTVLWVLVALPIRAHFAPLLARRAVPASAQVGPGRASETSA